MSKEFWYGFTSVQIQPDLNRRRPHIRSMDADMFARRVMLGQAAYTGTVVLLIAVIAMLLAVGLPEWIITIPALGIGALTIFQLVVDYKVFPSLRGRVSRV